jgi:hypothetical protein
MDDSACNRRIDVTNIEVGDRNIDRGMERTIIQRGWQSLAFGVLLIPPASLKHSFDGNRIKYS